VAWIPQEPRRRAPPATATLPDAVTPSPPANQPSPTDAPQQPDPPESKSLPRSWLGLDHLGVLQVLGGLALSLIGCHGSATEPLPLIPLPLILGCAVEHTASASRCRVLYSESMQAGARIGNVLIVNPLT
jgi:hypothetical protein